MKKAMERELARGSPEQLLRVRQDKSRPLVDAFFLYCHQQREQVLEQSPMWDALRYARNQEQALRREQQRVVPALYVLLRASDAAAPVPTAGC